MSRTLSFLLFLLIGFAPLDAKSIRRIDVPKDFLRTDNDHWIRMLQTDISVTFLKSPLSEIVTYFNQRMRANLVVCHEPAETSKAELPFQPLMGPFLEPTVTQEFHGDPFILVLHRVCRETGVTARWLRDEKGNPRAIELMLPK